MISTHTRAVGEGHGLWWGERERRDLGIPVQGGVKAAHTLKYCREASTKIAKAVIKREC
jgi:hypothetical protein